MTSSGAPPDFWRMTGGSTAKPVQLPAWSSETQHLRPETWLGRSWYGITPASRLFLIWGHAHLLGTGWRGAVRAQRAKLSDRLLGYRRFSAYDLRPERLRAAAAQLIRFRPEYLIGYSVALDRFARENEANADLRALGLKVVIGTAEGFPFADSESRLADLFGCPVAMEYGAVETGVIAHTRPGGGYEAFWNSCLLEIERRETGPALLVTTLYPRCFPLVRYEIGDAIEPEPAEPEIGLRRFKRVIGRCNDSVTLQDGAVVHSELFSHAIRPCLDVRGYQVVQDGDDVRIHFLSEAPLAPDSMKAILQRLGRIHPRLAAIPLLRVESLESTVAGKTRMVIRRDR
jgi:phenylacetate-coenzyme A ligase PaaK-like adenylate-forming protein